MTFMNDIFYFTTMMKFIPRGGWLMKGVRLPESLGDHSYGVAMATMIMGRELARREIVELNLEKALQVALIHDLTESLITDIPAPMTRFFGSDNKKNAEISALEEIFSTSPYKEEMRQMWLEFEEGSSAEGRLVRAADKIDMVLQLCRYEETGNRSLDDFWGDSDRIFASIGGSEEEKMFYSEVYESIRKKHFDKYPK